MSDEPATGAKHAVEPPRPGRTIDLDAIAWGPDGLVPVVAQDARDGRVLMVAYASREAVDATLATGDLHFHSRSRGRLWRKGETSGNVLRVRSLALDCDADAILASVDPAGPACHRGTGTCFDDAAADAAAGAIAPQGFAALEAIWATVADRAARRPAGSYTSRLIAGGPDATGRKVVEEATEVLIATKDAATADAGGVGEPDALRAARAALAGEAADLLFHLLVALAERGMEPAQVVAVLESRHGRAHRGGRGDGTEG
jgi:phosphoribosyl-ATP pyrophosphohydrolase/phosphoribosyl-AMP cyclohydrolase